MRRTWVLVALGLSFCAIGCEGGSPVSSSPETGEQSATDTATSVDRESCSESGSETNATAETQGETTTGTSFATESGDDTASVSGGDTQSESWSETSGETASDTASAPLPSCASARIELGPGEVATVFMDNADATDFASPSCAVDSDMPESAIEVVLRQPGRLIFSSAGYAACDEWPTPQISVFSGAPDEMCSSLGLEVACIDVCWFDAVYSYSTSALQPGTYLLVLSDTSLHAAVAFRFQLEFGCPPSTHLEGLECVNDTCAQRAEECAALHMTCSDAVSPAQCDECLAGFELSGSHCKRLGASYGDACATDADCPGSGETYWCAPGYMYSRFPGGYCLSYDAPECTAAGDPCTDDPQSVCVPFDELGTVKRLCLPACIDDTACRPGYECATDWRGTGYSACDVIVDCTIDGCRDDGGLLCFDRDVFDLCWDNPCEPDNPCDAVAHSDGQCTPREDNAFLCGCEAGYAFDPLQGTCEPWTCSAIDLETFSGRSILRSDDSCTLGTRNYGDVRVDCLNWSAPGTEVVYALNIPPGEAVRISASIDPAVGDWSVPVLYLLDRCDDPNGETCGQGDAVDIHYGVAIPLEPSLVRANSSGEAQTVFIVVDDLLAQCGSVQLTVQRQCPPGQHLLNDAGDCVENTCDDVAAMCAAVNKICDDAAGGARCGQCLPGYEPYLDRCVLAGSFYGGPCEKAADCLGHGELEAHILCHDSVGGSCEAIKTDDCAFLGQPCADDPSSLCFIDYAHNDKRCVHSCETQDDCREGYVCRLADPPASFRFCEPAN